MIAGRRIRDRKSAYRGQAFAELALTLSLLLLLLGGIVEYSNVNVQLFSVSDAARDGAGFAATHSVQSPAWDSSPTPAASTIPWAVQLEAPIPNTWYGDTGSSTSAPPNPPTKDGIGITYICYSACTPSASVCGYYSIHNSAFVALTGYTQANCVAVGNEVKVGVYYTVAPATNLLHGMFPLGIGVAYSTTMPVIS